MKEAMVFKNQSGYWVAECRNTRRVIYKGGSELEAYKTANFEGYLCS